MEQQIVGGILSQGPWAALFLAVGMLLWKFVQKHLVDMREQQSQQMTDLKDQHTQHMTDLKEESKANLEHIMTEFSRRDADMSVEMKNRDTEARAREDRLYAMIDRQNELITGDLQDIKSAIERSERFR